MNDIIRGMINNIDIDLFQSKGLFLDGNLTDRYYELLKKYKILFERYLLNKLPLSKYDEMICNSDFLFTPVKKEDMDFYQRFSSFGLNYIYLRSDLSVEKLSIDDISFVLNLDNLQLSNPDSEMFKFIERTFRDVIDCRIKDFEISLKKCYGIDRDVFWINSDELVFGLRYDEFIDNELGNDEKWLDNYNNQLAFIGKIIDELNNICSDILNLKVNFLYYDEFSVKNSLI